MGLAAPGPPVGAGNLGLACLPGLEAQHFLPSSANALSPGFELLPDQLHVLLVHAGLPGVAGGGIGGQGDGKFVAW